MLLLILMKFFFVLFDIFLGLNRFKFLFRDYFKKKIKIMYFIIYLVMYLGFFMFFKVLEIDGGGGVFEVLKYFLFLLNFKKF